MTSIYFKERIRVFIGEKKMDALGGQILEWKDKGSLWGQLVPQKNLDQKWPFSKPEKVSKIFKVTVRAFGVSRRFTPTTKIVTSRNKTYYGLSAPEISPCEQWVSWYVGAL